MMRIAPKFAFLLVLLCAGQASAQSPAPAPAQTPAQPPAPTSAPAPARPAANGPRYWFLDRLGASDLVPADWELLRQNVHLALYELGDSESVGWSEPATEHSGSVRVIGTVKEGDKICRRLRISVDVDSGSDDGVFEFCRSGDTGFWRLTTNALALHDD